ncbi:beta-galactosidase [Pseudactinotalea suaedae]|uniref:beta-galactosidase n=1 Tax=Pseudactinotalea suaedae TaxID=1524924 RepID=UPI00240E49DE|nr:beta-galactosidase [Pseudactinotalea suaedae]
MVESIHGLRGVGFGGDYNPEQWPDDVRLADLDLMREAGVTIVSLAIFGWASIEPREGSYDWSWLDDTMDRLHEAGIRVSLATATASPPPWLTRKHPEILPRTADGSVLSPGARQSYSVSSRIWRDYAVGLAVAVARRYADHPALTLWHVDNEIGCHVPHDFSDSAAAAFRRWLRARYGDIDSLNAAWGTAFWSQRYGDFEDVLPPRAAPSHSNPTQQLDFARYSSDELLSYYVELRDAIRPITPEIPITTNFMCTSATKWMDYRRWAAEVDIVANDHYTIAADAEREIELALSADLTRGVAGGRPWLLMEHSSGAVNWQPRNRAKGPGELMRNSLAHVARGADAVMFFQWRASQAGAEKFHSALVPHAGRDSQVFRDVVALGAAVGSLAPLTGSVVQARAALIWDYEAWWAVELDAHPSADVVYMDRMRALHAALWRRGITTDVVASTDDLDAYDLVLVPTLYLVSDEGAANIAAAAERGASVAITYFSGIVDPNDHVRLGGYPGAFRELLGVRVDEFFPLLDGETTMLDDGTTADLWSERVELAGAEAVRMFTDGAMAGRPAVTRRQVGSGAAWYVATRQDESGTAALVDALLAESGVAPVLDVPAGMEAVRRVGEQGSFVVVVNHTDEVVALDLNGSELITGSLVEPGFKVPAGGCAVVQEV